MIENAEPIKGFDSVAKKFKLSKYFKGNLKII